MSVNTIFKKTLLVASVATVLGASQSALAYQAGDFIVRGGVATVEPNETSSTISIADPALGDTGIGSVGVGTDTQLGFSLTYMYTDTVGIEVLGATPFSHDITLPALGGAKIAETKHLPPTVTLNWHLNEPGAKFQPYVGVGINYTMFFSEDTAGALDAGAFNALASAAAGGPAGITTVDGTDIDLDDSTGLAFKVGFDYTITDNLGLSASYYRIDIDTEAEITTTANGSLPVKATVDVDIDPSVYMAGIYYKF